MLDAFRLLMTETSINQPNHMNKLKLALVSVVVCVLMLAFSHNAGAAPAPLPPNSVSVPDGGATIMLLGAALGALGMARRFLKS
jgi:protein with PEP-CTERM/exosortase system signal